VDTNTKIVNGNNPNNYPAHKTITLIDEKTIANKVVEAVPEALVKSAEKTPTINTLVSDKTVINAYPSHKTIVIAPDVAKPLADTLKKELDALANVVSVPEIKTDATIVVPQNKNITVDSIISKVEAQNVPTDSYRAHKTVVLENEPITSPKAEITNVVNATIESANTKLNTEEVKQPISKPIEQTINTLTDNNLKNTYPAHKTFSFVVGEDKVVEAQTVLSSTQTTPTIENKTQPVVKATTNAVVETKESTAVVKTKKPLVWIIVSATILVTSAVAIWYSNQQKTKLQEEVAVLKQSNAALSENVQKLQKDLRIDDIIARAGTLDTKNNIVVQQDAIKSEVIRTCFSVMPNTNAKKGKKIVYVRLLDSAGNVVAINKNNTFEYKGTKVEYTEKKEIDFKGAELMLCVDYKSTQKLAKGTYKAELYNDGVLDGVSTFELK
jgi:hypothetical protein